MGLNFERKKMEKIANYKKLILIILLFSKLRLCNPFQLRINTCNYVPCMRDQPTTQGIYYLTASEGNTETCT
jgi:hypothetical protein